MCVTNIFRIGIVNVYAPPFKVSTLNLILSTTLGTTDYHRSILYLVNFISFQRVHFPQLGVSGISHLRFQDRKVLYH